MTRLQQAIEKLKHLPKRDQDRFATMVLDEAVWQETFKKTVNELDELGKMVLEEIKAGKFKRMAG